MNRQSIQSFLFVLPAFVFLLVACNHHDVLNIESSKADNEIADNERVRIQIGVSPQLRITNNEDYTCTWVNGDAIGIFAVEIDPTFDATDLKTENNYIHNAKLIFNNGSFESEAGKELWWPSDDSNLIFYAYYPYQAEEDINPTAISFTVNDDQRSIPNFNESDMLMAKADNGGAGYNKSNNKVLLKFDHAMAMVEITLDTKGESIFSENIEVKLLGVHNSYTLNLNDQSVSSVSSVSMSGNEIRMSQLKNTFTFRALLPPQEIEIASPLFNIEIENKNFIPQISSSEEETLTLAKGAITKIKVPITEEESSGE